MREDVLPHCEKVHRAEPARSRRIPECVPRSPLRLARALQLSLPAQRSSFKSCPRYYVPKARTIWSGPSAFPREREPARFAA